jgi:hypothetical protein
VSKYLKAIMAALGAGLGALSIYYGNTEWYPIVVSAVTAGMVYLTPNTTAAIPLHYHETYPTAEPAAEIPVPEFWPKES